MNLHPDAALERYVTADDFVSDVRRIAAWFSHPRRSCKVVPRKPLEDGASPSGPLLDRGNAKSFLDMVQEPTPSSLVRCCDSHHRFTEMGLRVPTGTTIVEQGFGASNVVMFEKTTRYVTPTTFRRHAMLTTLLLNFSTLRGQDMDIRTCSDRRVLMLLEMAWTRLHKAAGLPLSRSRRNAETHFRERVAEKEQASVATPVSAAETEPLLPYADAGVSGSESQDPAKLPKRSASVTHATDGSPSFGDALNQSASPVPF